MKYIHFWKAFLRLIAYLMCSFNMVFGWIWVWVLVMDRSLDRHKRVHIWWQNIMIRFPLSLSIAPILLWGSIPWQNGADISTKDDFFVTIFAAMILVGNIYIYRLEKGKTLKLYTWVYSSLLWITLGIHVITFHWRSRSIYMYRTLFKW